MAGDFSGVFVKMHGKLHGLPKKVLPFSVIIAFCENPAVGCLPVFFSRQGSTSLFYRKGHKAKMNIILSGFVLPFRVNFENLLSDCTLLPSLLFSLEFIDQFIAALNAVSIELIEHDCLTALLVQIPKFPFIIESIDIREAG